MAGQGAAQRPGPPAAARSIAPHAPTTRRTLRSVVVPCAVYQSGRARTRDAPGFGV